MRRHNDQGNHARADNEAEQMNIADTRTMYDSLLAHNQQLNTQHQTLQNNFVKSTSEFKEAYQQRIAFAASSPSRRSI